MRDDHLCSCGFSGTMVRLVPRSHRMKHANLRNVRKLQRALLVYRGVLPRRVRRVVAA